MWLSSRILWLLAIRDAVTLFLGKSLQFSNCYFYWYLFATHSDLFSMSEDLHFPLKGDRYGWAWDVGLVTWSVCVHNQWLTCASMWSNPSKRNYCGDKESHYFTTEFAEMIRHKFQVFWYHIGIFCQRSFTTQWK